MIHFITSGVIFTIFFIIASSIYAAEKLSKKYGWSYNAILSSFMFIESSIMFFILGILEIFKII